MAKKIGRPMKQPTERRTRRVYVYCRERDQGNGLRQALRAARDAYERKVG
jgi:hypothetical protein